MRIALICLLIISLVCNSSYACQLIGYHDNNCLSQPSLLFASNKCSSLNTYWRLIKYTSDYRGSCIGPYDTEDQFTKIMFSDIITIIGKVSYQFNITDCINNDYSIIGKHNINPDNGECYNSFRLYNQYLCSKI